MCVALAAAAHAAAARPAAASATAAASLATATIPAAVPATLAAAAAAALALAAAHAAARPAAAHAAAARPAAASATTAASLATATIPAAVPATLAAAAAAALALAAAALAAQPAAALAQPAAALAAANTAALAAASCLPCGPERVVLRRRNPRTRARHLTTTTTQRTKRTHRESRGPEEHELITEDDCLRPDEYEYDNYNQEVIVVLENETLNDMETGDENKTPEIKTTDEQFRFKSQSAQPWPHGMLYQTPRIEILAKDLSSKDGLESYKRKYGSTANLYVGGSKIASDLLDPTAKVKMQYGFAHLELLRSKLFCSDKKHKEQMIRILRIYADEGMFGRRGSNLYLTAPQKRDGFNFGVALDASSERKAPGLECLSAKYNGARGQQKRVVL